MHLESNLSELATTDLRPSRSAPAAEYARVRVDVATRLRRVCGDMPPQAFDALLDDICAIKVRWAQEAARGRHD